MNMKSEMPNWLKYLIIIVAIVLVAYVVIWVIENRVYLYKQWKRKQGEIRHLIYERGCLIKRKIRLDNYAKLTIMLIKCLCLSLVGLLSHYLTVTYKYDPFNAFVTSIGIVGAIYSIICILLYNKVFGLNELQERVCMKVTTTIYFVGKFKTARIMEIENELQLKINEADNLTQQIKTNHLI
jgi:hypothetical protein